MTITHKNDNDNTFQIFGEEFIKNNMKNCLIKINDNEKEERFSIFYTKKNNI